MEIKSNKEDFLYLDEKDSKLLLENNFKFDTWYKVIEKVNYHFNSGEVINYYKLEGIECFVKESMFCETKDADKNIKIRILFEGEPL